MKPGKSWWLLKIPPPPDSLETIQNSLNYWSWKEGLLIWSTIEMINFLFKWNSISLHIYIKTTWKSYFKNNEKNTWKFTKKNWKNLEKSWNFVSPKKWEPWSCLLLRKGLSWVTWKWNVSLKMKTFLTQLVLNRDHVAADHNHCRVMMYEHEKLLKNV